MEESFKPIQVIPLIQTKEMKPIPTKKISIIKTKRLTCPYIMTLNLKKQLKEIIKSRSFAMVLLLEQIVLL